MNLHEYQGKELLASYGIAIQRGFIASNVDEAIAAFKRVNEELGSSMAVVKAQIHAGGRGKGGRCRETGQKSIYSRGFICA